MKVQSPVNQTINQSAKNVYVSVRNFPHQYGRFLLKQAFVNFSDCFSKNLNDFKKRFKDLNNVQRPPFLQVMSPLVYFFAVALFNFGDQIEKLILGQREDFMLRFILQ